MESGRGRSASVTIPRRGGTDRPSHVADNGIDQVVDGSPTRAGGAGRSTNAVSSGDALDVVSRQSPQLTSEYLLSLGVHQKRIEDRARRNFSCLRR